MKYLKNKTILVVSNEPWGEMWYSKHYWAHELSKNNMVYFLNPPKRWKLANLFCKKFIVTKYSSSLKILKYKKRIPLTRMKVFTYLNDRLVFMGLNRFLKSEKVVFWSFDPNRLVFTQFLKAEKRVYFAADYYNVGLEKILLKNTGYFISVSNTILQRYKLNNVRKLLLNHGVSNVLDEDILNRSGAILMASFTDRINYGLLEKIITQNSDIDFYLFGKENIINPHLKEVFYRIIEVRNTHYYGAKYYNDIIKIMKNTKVGLVMYNTDIFENQLNSLKVIQYLSCGLEVISTPFEYYQKPEEKLIFMTNNEHEYLERFTKVIYEEIDLLAVKRRIEFAKTHTYANQIDLVDELLSAKEIT